MADDTLETSGTPGGSSATTVDPAKSDPDSPPSPETSPAVAPKKPGRRRKQKGFVRRHKILIALAVLLALIAGGAYGAWWWADRQLSAIPRVDAGITGESGGEPHQDQNILILGADNGAKQESVADDLKDGKWTPFAHRSDTIMIAHIPADRDSVQLVSIPRDSWVQIPGYPSADEHAKINAAFAYGGPKLAVQTVQNLTGIHIDHIAIIDWIGFKDLTTALGGVRVYIPETFYDDSQRITWEKGWHTLEGTEALQYVRTRHGLANGDFGRIERQQNFMRATMQKLLSSMHGVGAVNTIKHLLSTLKDYLTIDKTWSNGDIRSLAFSLGGIRSSNVQFLTAPLGKYGTSADGQSYVKLAPKQSKLLFKSINNDDLQAYLAKHPDSELSGSRNVQ
jgi:LCP family protein required for cell wall assembly